MLTRDVRRRVEREQSLHQLARTLSRAVSVQEVARQAVQDAVISTRASGAYVERARDDAVEVIAAAGERTPSVDHVVDYDASLTEAPAGATEPITMNADAIGQLATPYLDRSHGGSGLVMPLRSRAADRRCNGFVPPSGS